MASYCTDVDRLFFFSHSVEQKQHSADTDIYLSGEFIPLTFNLNS